MEYEVVIAPRTVEDLKDIVLYIATDRPEADRRLAMALVERTKILGPFGWWISLGLRSWRSGEERNASTRYVSRWP